jgi:hypothetical protein
MSQYSLGLSPTAASVQDDGSSHEIEVAIPVGPDPLTLDLTLQAGFEALPGVYPDLEARSPATLEITRPDGSASAVLRRGAYRLGGTARFRVPIAKATV